MEYDTQLRYDTHTPARSLPFAFAPQTVSSRSVFGVMTRYMRVACTVSSREKQTGAITVRLQTDSTQRRTTCALGSAKERCVSVCCHFLVAVVDVVAVVAVRTGVVMAVLLL